MPDLGTHRTIDAARLARELREVDAYRRRRFTAPAWRLTGARG